MNETYERYLRDEDFRAGILAAARRERARAIGGFFSRLFTFNFHHRKPAHAPRTHFTLQG
jgi:hypothetical protein